MGATLDTPVLGAEPRQTLRRFAERVAALSGMEVERTGAQAILAVLDGSPAAASGLLDTVDPAGLAAQPEGVAATLAIAAFIAGEPDRLGAIAAAHHAPDLRIAVSVVDAVGRVPHRGIVGCTVAGGRPAHGLSFALGRRLYEAPGLITLMSRWFATIPLFVRAAQNPGAVGSTSLQLIDGAFRPGLGFCARDPCVTLIPDPDFMRHRGYASARQHAREHALPWAERRRVALWRGAPNGFPAEKGDWRSIPRIRLCTLAATHPDLFDAGITAPLPAQHPGHAALADSGLVRPPVASQDFGGWRYLIDIDGYTNAWSGLFTKLLTGSAVLKVESAGGWRQWYYDLLKPWVHYVPVSADLSDLADRVRWLIGHDEKAAAIGAAGQALAESLTYERQVDWAACIIAKSLR